MYRFLRLGSKVFASNFKTLAEPYKLTFAVTYKCNSKCKTCGIWKKKTKDELSTREIQKIFDKINPSWVNLTGGESFLREDFYDIVKIISQKDVYILNMTTNAILFDKIVDDLKKILELNIPKVIVVVSLDGPKLVHDKIRGVKSNWIKAINLYKYLKQLSKNCNNFQTFFGYTISEHNIGLIEKTLNEVNKQVNVNLSDFHFNIYTVSSFYYANSNQYYLQNFNKKILRDIDFISKEKKRFGSISLLEKKYTKLIKKYFETGMSPLSCKAFNSSCFIEPDGNIYPCIAFNKKIGNIRDFDYNLKNIWKSEDSQNIRKLIKEKKCDGCWTPCEAYQTILGNIFRI